MKRTLIHPNIQDFPLEFHPYIMDSNIYDSSSSDTAAVFYIEKSDGYYLKTAPADSLKKEADMLRFFHQHNLGAEVILYTKKEKDWLLTKRISGEDCTHASYLSDPIRLCDTLAEILFQLHSVSTHDFSFSDCLSPALLAAKDNLLAARYNSDLFLESDFAPSLKEAKIYMENASDILHADTLIHGDYCLPNILLDNWKFSGFIDVGAAGLGDRHTDIFWALWSLHYNLKTNKYADRFLDAYGREKIDTEALRTAAVLEALL